jgi:hypothetical protein
MTISWMQLSCWSLAVICQDGEETLVIPAGRCRRALIQGKGARIQLPVCLG